MITLHMPRLLLRECLPEDAEALRAFDTNPAIWQFRGGALPSAEQSAKRLVRKLSAPSEQPRTRFPLLVFGGKEGPLIGTATLRITHLANAEAELSGALDPPHWGHGLATEAGQALLAWAFGDLGLHRVWATANPENAGSWRVMEKLYMRREGRLRSVERVGEAWRDQYLYAILADEWQATTTAKL